MLLKKTFLATLLAVLAIGIVAVGLTRSETVAGGTDAAVQAKIADAMRAGPAAIAKGATILDYQQDAAGKFVVLRQGSNGWSCFPDTPARRATIRCASTRRG